MAQATKRRGISHEMKQRVETWIRTEEEIEVSIGVNPADTKSPMITLGEVRLFLQAGWNPPIGARRKIIIKANRNGMWYAAPAPGQELLTNELNLYSQRFFRAELQYDYGKKRFFFRLPNGMFLIPMNFRLWAESGIENYVGRTIELVGYPKTTSFAVWPKYGLDKDEHGRSGLDLCEQIGESTNAKTEKEAIKLEKDLGLIRIAATTIPAIYILGISNDEVLTHDMIEKAARKAMISYHPDVNQTKGLISIKAGSDNILGFSSAELYQKIHEAKDILLGGMDRWYGKTWEEVYANDEPIVNGNDKSPDIDQPVEIDTRLVKCKHCRRLNNLGNLPPSKADLAVCGQCGEYLFPERAEKANQEIEKVREMVRNASHTNLKIVAREMHIALQVKKGKKMVNKAIEPLRQDILDKIE